MYVGVTRKLKDLCRIFIVLKSYFKFIIDVSETFYTGIFSTVIFLPVSIISGSPRPSSS